MSSMADMIRRFRSGVATPRDVRDDMKKDGKLREMWWVDDEATHHGRHAVGDHDEDSHDADEYAEDIAMARERPSTAYSRHRQQPEKRGGTRIRVLDDDYDDHEISPARSSGRKATSKGKSRIEREDEEMDDIYGLRSSIDDFIAEDFMRLSNVNSKGGGGGQGGGKFSGSASLRGHSDWVDSLGGSKNMTMGGTGGGPAKYRFIPSPKRADGGEGNSYDFHSKELGGTLERELENYLRPHAAPFSTIESVLRQATLRSTLGESTAASIGPKKEKAVAKRSIADATFGDIPPVEENNNGAKEDEQKDPYGDLDKYVTTAEVTQGLEITMSRLSQNFKFDREEIKKAMEAPRTHEDDKTGAAGVLLSNGSKESSILPASISQIAEDLEMSLMPFNTFYYQKEEEEKMQEEAGKKARGDELKKIEERIRLEVFDSLSAHWGVRSGDEDDEEYYDDNIVQYEIYDHEDDQTARQVHSFGHHDQVSVPNLRKQKDPNTRQGAAVTDPLDIARQMAEVAEMVAAKVKVIEGIERGGVGLITSSTALTSTKPDVTSGSPPSPVPPQASQVEGHTEQKTDDTAASKPKKVSAAIALPESPDESREGGVEENKESSHKATQETTESTSKADKENKPAAPFTTSLSTGPDSGNTTGRKASARTYAARAVATTATGLILGDALSARIKALGGPGRRPTLKNPTPASSSREVVTNTASKPPLASSKPSSSLLPRSSSKRILSEANRGSSDLSSRLKDEGAYGDLTVQKTSKSIVSDLEVSMLCMMKRLGMDPSKPLSEENVPPEGESKTKKEDEVAKKAKEDSEMAKWLEEKGDELALAMQKVQGRARVHMEEDIDDEGGLSFSQEEEEEEEEERRERQRARSRRRQGKGGYAGGEEESSGLADDEDDEGLRRRRQHHNDDDIDDGSPIDPPPQWRKSYTAASSRRSSRSKGKGEGGGGRGYLSSPLRSPASLSNRHHHHHRLEVGKEGKHSSRINSNSSSRSKSRQQHHASSRSPRCRNRVAGASSLSPQRERRVSAGDFHSDHSEDEYLYPHRGDSGSHRSYFSRGVDSIAEARSKLEEYKYHRGAARRRQEQNHDSMAFPFAKLSSSLPPGPSRYIHSYPSTRPHPNTASGNGTAAPSSSAARPVAAPPSISTSSSSSSSAASTTSSYSIIEDANDDIIMDHHNKQVHHSSINAGHSSSLMMQGSLDLYQARQKLHEFQELRHHLTAKAAVVA